MPATAPLVPRPPQLLRNPQPPRPRRLPPLQNPLRRLRPRPRHRRQPRPNRQLPAVKKFAALRESAKLRVKIILTFPRFPARAPADASAKATFSAPCKAAHPRRQLLPERPAQPRHRQLVPQEFLQPQAAPAHQPFSRTPCRAKKCISATMKFSPCPSCASASPSTWSSRSTSPPTSIRWTKRI